MERNVLISISALANTPRDGSWIPSPPTLKEPGLPLPTSPRPTVGASTLLTLSAFWSGPGPARLTTSPFPASQPRQGLGIHAASSPLGSCGALGPAWSLRGWGGAPGRSVGPGEGAKWSQQLFPPGLSLSAALGPENPPSMCPKASLSSKAAISLFPSPGGQARPGLPPAGEPAPSKGQGGSPRPRTAHRFVHPPPSWHPRPAPRSPLSPPSRPPAHLSASHLHRPPQPLPFGLVVDAPGSLS
ncbi:unnamed protein product [Nyctereutes procyonoides]|uniref:(raccoon dog) hypothetical protein n=1 Tax=Nyctereutes procyonoides TaxID=34880 RepID=A0A811ZNN2_NYCPR|nr:unnamed protein product [Nyctereutes procyonoides]